jgi:ADP-ribose pyrophosphatase YjhB (NUDIX family)
MPVNTELLLTSIKRIQALAEIGLHYSHNDFDQDRYSEIDQVSKQLLSILTGEDIEVIAAHVEENNGYKTPKVDVRAVVFDDQGKVLMVKEKVDEKWSLPGGWADVGLSPAEVAEKETLEEAGMHVKAKKLLAVFDKKFHDHPPDLHYAYKIFILCERENDVLDPGYETLDAAFFSETALPELSLPRNTEKQLSIIFTYRNGKPGWPYIDLGEAL